MDVYKNDMRPIGTLQNIIRDELHYHCLQYAVLTLDNVKG